jgi:hypothetical protein
MNKVAILIIAILGLGAIAYFLIKKYSFSSVSSIGGVPTIQGAPTLPSGLSPVNPNPLHMPYDPVPPGEAMNSSTNSSLMPSDPVALAHDATPLVFSPSSSSSSSSSINEEGTVTSNPSPSPSIITVTSNPSPSTIIPSSSPSIHTSGSTLIGRRVFIT